MRNLKWYFVAACLVSAAVFGLIPRAKVSADDRSIVGAWIVTTMPDTPPGASPFAFSELAAFNPGGTWTDTHAIAHGSEIPFLPPPLAVDSSDAFGSWQRVGDSNQFATTLKRLLFAGSNTPMSLYGPFFPGQNVGMETVNTVLTLQTGQNGDTLQGPFVAQFANLNGQVVFTAAGTVMAKRVKVEAPAAP
jgi:hypothetical protein